MSRKERSSSRKAASTPTTTSVCYCDGNRQLGTLELYCTGCCKWFHGSCLKDLSDFYGLNYMVSYTFYCKNCSNIETETWTPKQANFVHMCVTALANLTSEELNNKGIDLHEPQKEHIHFNVEKRIIPYFNENWNLLTSMPKRVKNTWHGTLLKALAKETELFQMHPTDENSYALAELDLSLIGPNLEAVKQIGKKASSSNNLSTTLVEQQKIEKLASDDGPKTRGASKRKTADNTTTSTQSKKQKMTADYSQTRVGANNVDIPFNKDGYRYYMTEKDHNVNDSNLLDDEESTQARTIPGHLYRIFVPPEVTLSSNDRAYQLRLSEDNLSITGHEGYCVARATHSVGAGSWYYEAQLTKTPGDGAVRIGWAQQYAVVQACVGYNKFSYGIRSLKGTKFHNGFGKSYYPEGFQEGDVIGCLIHLPFDPTKPGPNSAKYLPNCGKDHTLIKFKNNYFYEEHEENHSTILKGLHPLKGSYIEFFHNGKSCGVAFTDIYEGFYYPAVSLFHQSTMNVNFGPSFAYPPPEGVRAMSERAGELVVEQSLSDMLYLVQKGLYRNNV